MVIDKEEYKKVHETLSWNHGKRSEVRWYFANKNRGMGCSGNLHEYNMSIVDVLKELQNVYKTLDAFRCSDSVSRYVSAVCPWYYEIENPVVHFHEMEKEGAYLTLSDKEYESKIKILDAMSFHPDVKNKSEYVHLDVRDAYSDAMKAVSDLQSALKKIHDSALFVSILNPFYTEQYFELDERDREQVDKIEGEEYMEDFVKYMEAERIYAHGMLSKEDLSPSNFIVEGGIIKSYLNCKDAFEEDDNFDVKEDGLYTSDGKTCYIREYSNGNCAVNESFYRFLVSFNSDWTFAKGRFSLAMSEWFTS